MGKFGSGAHITRTNSVTGDVNRSINHSEYVFFDLSTQHFVHQCIWSIIWILTFAVLHLCILCVCLYC